MKKPELLAPVGNLESLYAAIEAGADAVYLGGTFFGARSYANNFDNEQLINAINYAHIYAVKVYVTVNTIIYEAEVKAFMEYIEFLHKNNVDAVIMQDLGMIDLVRKTFPNLEIHASTQMHIHNLEGVLLAQKLNISRVVLARETNIETIKNIKENCNIELEVFVHGALCICYSGQCLMSSLIGKRSGNRGTCSQPCRMKYDLISNNQKINDNNYLLSTKDLNTLENIDKLLDIGIDSLKIEGRMKRPEYVYQVISLYRQAIDSYYENKQIKIDEKELKKLSTLFNRKYTKGFLFNENNKSYVNNYRPNHMGIEIGTVIENKNNLVKIKLTDEINRLDGIRIISKEDVGLTLQNIIIDNVKKEKAYKNEIITIKLDKKVEIGDKVVKTTDKKIIDEINRLINNHQRKVKLDVYIECYKNQQIKLIVNDNNNTIEIYSDEIIEQSLKAPIDEEAIKEKISKLGNTPYILENIEIKMDNDIFIRINTLNELKRKMIDLITKKRLYKIEFIKKDYFIDLKSFDEETGYNILIDDVNNYEINNKIKNIYLNEDLYFKINDSKKILKLPRVINKYKEYDNEVLIGEIGSINKYKNIISDFSFNVVNSYTVALLHSLNVKRITLSYELNEYQIKKIIDNYKKRYNETPNLELIVSSKPEVMISKFRLLDFYNVKNDNNYLSDDFNNKFKIIENEEFMTIYFHKKITIENYQNYFDMGINTLRIHIDNKEDYKLLV
ncbi:MAG: U32 family peptidase [Bacilli bacterium]|nr:U32 family peptidase [Bacilli bacterium]